jgi:hypothetical protein
MYKVGREFDGLTHPVCLKIRGEQRCTINNNDVWFVSKVCGRFKRAKIEDEKNAKLTGGGGGGVIAYNNILFAFRPECFFFFFVSFRLGTTRDFVYTRSGAHVSSARVCSHGPGRAD